MQLRRLVIGEVSRFPDLAKVLYERGPQRALTRLTAVFERLAARGLLTIDDPSVAASQFNWVIMADPLNRAMLLGDRRSPRRMHFAGTSPRVCAYSSPRTPCVPSHKPRVKTRAAHEAVWHLNSHRGAGDGGRTTSATEAFLYRCARAAEPRERLVPLPPGTGGVERPCIRVDRCGEPLGQSRSRRRPSSGQDRAQVARREQGTWRRRRAGRRACQLRLRIWRVPSDPWTLRAARRRGSRRAGATGRGDDRARPRVAGFALHPQGVRHDCRDPHEGKACVGPFLQGRQPWQHRPRRSSHYLS